MGKCKGLVFEKDAHGKVVNTRRCKREAGKNKYCKDHRNQSSKFWKKAHLKSRSPRSPTPRSPRSPLSPYELAQLFKTPSPQVRKAVPVFKDDIIHGLSRLKSRKHSPRITRSSPDSIRKLLAKRRSVIQVDSPEEEEFFEPRMSPRRMSPRRMSPRRSPLKPPPLPFDAGTLTRGREVLGSRPAFKRSSPPSPDSSLLKSMIRNMRLKNLAYGNRLSKRRLSRRRRRFSRRF